MSFFELVALAKLSDFIKSDNKKIVYLSSKKSTDTKISFTEDTCWLYLKKYAFEVNEIIGSNDVILLRNLFKNKKNTFSVNYRMKHDYYENSKRQIVTNRRFYEAYYFLLCMSKVKIFYQDIIKLIFFTIRGKIEDLLICDNVK